MRMSSHGSLAAVMMLLALGAGCKSGTEPIPTPSSASQSSSPSASSMPSATPTVSQAHVDVARAEEAVVSFWGVLDRVGASTEEDPNALATVARDQALAQWQNIVAGYRSKGLVTKGATVPEAVKGAKKSARAFEVQACIDVSGVDLVDAAGKSVVTSNRPDRQQYTYAVEKAADGFFVTRDTLKGKPC